VHRRSKVEEGRLTDDHCSELESTPVPHKG
jgi:hypothetical protein